MTSDQQKKNALQGYIDAYNRNDLEAVLALYSDDASVEDPYGTPAKRGKAEIRAFYTEAMASGAKLQLDAPIRASHGDAAAITFTAALETGQGMVRVHVTDIMTFNDQGLINSMRAYFGPSDIEMPKG